MDSGIDPILTLTFLAALEPLPDGSDPIEFRYVMADAVRVAIPRAWWERLGSPDAVDVTVVPAEGDV